MSVLDEELRTWKITDEARRWEKLERERVRYPRMLRELGIPLLRLDDKAVLDVGCGPVSALEFLPHAGRRVAADPLVDEYAEVYPERDSCIEWYDCPVEKLEFENDSFDVILCMNALDHVEEPATALIEMRRVLSPGGYLAVHCCENNARINPHPAHRHNLTLGWLRNLVDGDFETVVERRVRYGWVKWRGKVGQPAFVWMGRLTTGY